MTTKKTNRSASFDKYVQQKLLDPDYAREYINATLEAIQDEDEATPEEFIQTLIGCLRDVIEAHGGINQFSKKIPEIHRSTLYGIFSDKEKRKNGPEFLTVIRIMKVCGISIKAA